jgi:predicted ribosomally synthesized peptide with SipW-like signal peptide
MGSEETADVQPGKAPRAGLSPTVVVALVGALSALLGGGVTAYFNSQTEKGKSRTEIDNKRLEVEGNIHTKEMEVRGNLDLEAAKNAEAQDLARQEFETRLIMQAVQGATPDVATGNLQFFLKAGFISDPFGKISKLSAEAPPMIPAPGTNLSGLAMKDAQACSKFEAQDFKGAATPYTDKDVEEVAATLGVDVPTLRAVIEVESLPPFTDGRPTMLFERQVFSRLTKHVNDEKYPDISNRAPGGYGTAGTSQYARLKKAMALDCGAALGATSWGLSGLTGMNYGPAGFESLDEMIGALMESGRGQLDILAHFIRTDGLAPALQRQNWAEFARRFNGPDFARAKYDLRLAEAYNRLSGGK